MVEPKKVKSFFDLYKILNNVFYTTIIPGSLNILYVAGLIGLGTFKLCLIGSFILFIIIPFIFKYSFKLQQAVLFLTFIAHPSKSVLEFPHKSGLYATRKFHISHRDPEDNVDVQIGVWHVLPNYVAKKFPHELNLTEDDLKTLADSKILKDYEEQFEPVEKDVRMKFEIATKSNEQDFYEYFLKTSKTPIILYLHGNSGSRAASHRVELYQLLRDLGYHVISFDYRGYGDSTRIGPTESGVVRDAIAVYKYIVTISKIPVIAWGHSLGTGVLSNMLATLERSNIYGPRAAILESPFNNIRDEVREHPFAKLFRKLPWFNYTIADPMYANHLRFESDRHIAAYRQPITIIHAEDDLVVPFKLGYKLYRAGLDSRKKSWGPIEFHRFESSSRYGHKYLCRAPELPAIIDRFIQLYKNEHY